MKIILASAVIFFVAIISFIIVAFYLGVFEIKYVIRRWKEIISENNKKHNRKERP